MKNLFIFFTILFTSNVFATDLTEESFYSVVQKSEEFQTLSKNFESNGFKLSGKHINGPEITGLVYYVVVFNYSDGGAPCWVSGDVKVNEEDQSLELLEVSSGCAMYGF